MNRPIRIELPTVFGMKTVNTYLFTEPEPVLIDCGEKTEASWKALQQGLKKYNLQVEDIKRVIITHAHVDHMGMAGKIARESSAEVWVSDLVYDWAIDVASMWNSRGALIGQTIQEALSGLDNLEMFLQYVKTFAVKTLEIWDNVPSKAIRVFPITGSLEFGGKNWKILYTPGHSNTQTCFFNEKDGQFLSADMLLKKTATPVIDMDQSDPGKRMNSLAKMLESYQKIAALKITEVYPGHYEPFENANEVIKNQVDRIHLRKEQCYTLIENGKHSFAELFSEMYHNNWNLPALSMLFGYLDLLEDEGRITTSLINGKRYYSTSLITK